MATFHDSALGSASASSVGPLATADALAVTAGDLVIVANKWESGGTTVVNDSGASTPQFSVANAPRTEAGGLSVTGAVNFWTATATGTINPRQTLGVAKDFREIRAVSITPAAGKTFILGNINAADGPSLATAISAGTASAAGAGVGVTAIALNGSRTITPGSGWTEPAELNTSISAHAQYQLISGAGTITGDCTLSSAVEFVIQLALFTEVSTGGSKPLARFPNKGPLRQNYGARTIGFRQGIALSVSPDVTLALTGQSAAFTAGSLVPSTDVPLVGQAAAFTAGTVVPSASVALLGQAAAFAAGTLTPSSAVPLLGQAAALAAGALVPSSTVPVLGQTAAFSAGALVAAPQIPLLGQASAFSAGTVIPDTAVPLLGQVAVFTTGFVTVPGDVTIALIGQSAAFIAGTMLALVQESVVDQQPTGGGWPIFALRYEQELARRRRKKREQEELEQESRELQNQLDREIALLLREQEAKDAKRAELERVKALAEYLSATEAQAQYGERVAKALERATIRASYSTLEALDREIQRARQEEEFLVLAFAMLLEDNDA